MAEQTTESTSPGVIVGRNVARIRNEHGWTQPDLAAYLEAAGSRLTRAALASLESGRREEVTVSELVLLAHALEVAVPDLLDNPVDVVVGDGVSVTAGSLPHSFGASVPGPFVWSGDSIDSMVRGRMLLRAREEQKVGGALGVSHDAVVRLADTLWHHPYGVEHQARVEARLAESHDRRAARGHVTRELVREMDEALGPDKIVPKRDKPAPTAKSKATARKLGQRLERSAAKKSTRETSAKKAAKKKGGA